MTLNASASEDPEGNPCSTSSSTTASAMTDPLTGTIPPSIGERGLHVHRRRRHPLITVKVTDVGR